MASSTSSPYVGPRRLYATLDLSPGCVCNVADAFTTSLRLGGIFAHYYEQHQQRKFALFRARGGDAMKLINNPDLFVGAFPQCYRTPLRICLCLWLGAWYIVSNPYLHETFWQTPHIVADAREDTESDQRERPEPCRRIFISCGERRRVREESQIWAT